jgi:diadenosine tetraphosphate (Ap4A) HIT family hydrolase
MAAEQLSEGCRTCAALRGEISLTTVPRFHTGAHWVLEHVSPCSVKGWIVVVLKRHCRALHELSAEEYAELGLLLRATCTALHETLHSEKEYVMQFAEGEGFHHVHMHVIARTPDWPTDFRGPRVFNAMDAKYGAPLTVEELTPFAEAFGTALHKSLAGSGSCG